MTESTPAAQPADAYEYKVVGVGGTNPAGEEIEAIINPLGAEGWMVIAVSGRMIILTRPLDTVTSRPAAVAVDIQSA